MYIVNKYQNKIPRDLDTFLKWSNIPKKSFLNKLLQYDSLNIKNNKIYNTDKNIFSNLKFKSNAEIEMIENKLNYIKTKKLENELTTDPFNIFGRTYMDEKNFKALE